MTKHYNLGMGERILDVLRTVLRALVDALLFLSSYTVLFGALAMRWRETPWLLWGCIALTVAGLASTAFVLHSRAWIRGKPIQIEAAENHGADVSGYMATYLLPFVVVERPDAWDVGAYALVLAVMGLVYVRANMLHINPLLYLFNFRLFQITARDPHEGDSEPARIFTGYLLASREPSPGDRLDIVQRDHIMFEIGVRGGQHAQESTATGA